MQKFSAGLIAWAASLILVLCLSGTSPTAVQAGSAAGQDSILSRYYQWLDQGEAALDDIMAAIQSDNWRMRTHGLLAIGQVGGQKHIPLVMERLVKDDNRAVKNCAVTALGDLKAKAAVPDLLEFLAPASGSVSRPVQPQKRVVVKALGKIGDPRAVEPLCRMLLAYPNQQMRSEIRDALIAIGDPSVSRLLLKAATEKKPFPYAAAAEVIGELPVQGAEPFLLKLLDHERRTVKNAAAVALASTGTEKSVPSLLETFRTAPSHLQKNIADALVAIDSEKAVKPFCQMLSSPEQKTAMTAAAVLSRMTAGDIADRVFARFQDNHSINAPAAYVLGRKAYAPAAATLKNRLKQMDKDGHDEMAEALGRIGARDAVPLLIRVAQRENEKGAAGAIWSLGRLEAENAVPVLLSLLGERSRRLTAPLIYALGEIGDPKATKPLIELFYETGLRYQLQIGLALANIGGPRVKEFINANIESGNPKRLRMAGYMLMKSRDKSLIPLALKLLAHDSEDLQRYAIGALKNITGLDYDTASRWRTWAEKNKYLN